MADDNNLSATLTNEPDSSGGLSNSIGTPETTSTPSKATLTPPAATPKDDLATLQPAIDAAGAASAQDMPRMSRLKASLAGFLLSGIPGAVTGAINPDAVKRTMGAAQQVQKANITFANARAAHEVAMAHQADLELQALPDKLRDEAEQRGIDTVTKARQAGYMPIADIPLDQGKDQNAQNASAALDSVKQQFGAVPSGLLYIHTGRTMTVMKLQNPAAALDTVNQTRRAQGLAPVDQGTYLSLSANDRDNMTREALNFVDPKDVNGMVTQNSLNIANMRLQTVKAQPDFGGKDELVKQLEQTVQHQKAVLDSGAAAEAIRKGQAAGAEAQAAQPGETAAKVSEIKATAGPEAAAAAQKAGAVRTAENKADIAALGGNTTDILGAPVNPPPGGVKEYNKVKDSFKKDADDLAKTEGTFGMFNQVLNDINSGKDVTGAQSVVALFNAIGLSATPLKGMGMRINSNTVSEHIGARGIGQAAYQKFLSLKNGDVITPQQIKDYANIALQARHDAYVNKINEARASGVNPSFLLPRGNGGKIDSNTAKIFYDTAAGNNPQEKAANALKAAKAVGWQ